jgi:hypothetical protein
MVPSVDRSERLYLHFGTVVAANARCRTHRIARDVIQNRTVAAALELVLFILGPLLDFLAVLFVLAVGAFQLENLFDRNRKQLVIVSLDFKLSNL